MNYILKKKIPFLLLLILIFLIGFFSRIDSLKNHFTHVDDIGVAKVIIDSKKNPIIKNIFDENHENYNNKYKIIIRENFNEDSKILKFLRNVFPFISVSFYYSYSPIQFIFTNFLLEFADTYEEIKVFGRIPSLILSIFSFIIFFKLGSKIFNKEDKYILLFCISIFYLSWEYIFISSLMHNYGFGILSILIILNNYIFYKNTAHDLDSLLTKKKAFLLAILFYCSYQVLILIIAFGLYTIFNKIKKKDNFLEKNFLTFFLIVGILILPGLIWISVSDFGSISDNSWNSGKNGIFYFQISNLESLNYFFSFFFKNLYYIFSRSLSFFPENSYFFDFIFLLLLLIVIFGIIVAFRDKNENKNNFIIFSFFIFSIWLVLVFFNKLTLSPTRHSIILLPIFLIFLGYGLVAVSNLLIKFKGKKLNTFFQLFLIFFVFFNFIYSYKDITNPKLSLINENKFLSILKNHDVGNVIIYDEHFVDMYLMPSLIKNNINVSNYKIEITDQTKSVSFISAKNPISDKNLNFLNFDQEKWYLIYSSEEFLGGEIEYSNLTTNRPNQFYHYIYARLLD